MKYFANFITSNGTQLINAEKDTNKNRLIRYIRRRANDERGWCEGVKWTVWNDEGDIVAKGATSRYGVKSREI